MGTPTIIAFVCFGLAALLCIVEGAVHFGQKEFMPYAAEGLGCQWKDLQPGLQLLMLGSIKSTGGGFLATGISMAFMLFFPFRSGESWARYAITAVGLLMTIPVLFSSYQFRKKTPGKPPVEVLAGQVGLILVGFVLSLF